MPDPDVLEKATEALRNWLKQTFCAACRDKSCTTGAARRDWCSIQLMQAWANEPARAVLEAAGVGNEALLERVLALTKREKELREILDAVARHIFSTATNFCHCHGEWGEETKAIAERLMDVLEQTRREPALIIGPCPVCGRRQLKHQHRISHKVDCTEWLYISDCLACGWHREELIRVPLEEAQIREAEANAVR